MVSYEIPGKSFWAWSARWMGSFSSTVDSGTASTFIVCLTATSNLI